VHSKLPFERRILTSGGGPWDSMYVDHSRIIGIRGEVSLWLPTWQGRC
jgi:hypothetical protein